MARPESTREIVERIRRSRGRSSEWRRGFFSMAAAGFLLHMAAELLPIGNVILQEEFDIFLLDRHRDLRAVGTVGLFTLVLGVVGVLLDTADRCFNRVPRPRRRTASSPSQPPQHLAP